MLDPDRKRERRQRPIPRGGGARRRAAPATAPARSSSGPFAAVGPYQDGRHVRLERVPGGLRLAVWAAGSIAREAPVLAAEDMPRLFGQAIAQGVVASDEAERLRAGAGPDAAAGASPGRSGELRDELRVEPLEDGRVRIARWIMRPNFGWELQEAPVMLPAARFAEALASGAAGPARPSS